MPVEFFISLYVLMTYEKHRKLNLRKTSKKLKFLEVLGCFKKPTAFMYLI